MKNIKVLTLSIMLLMWVIFIALIWVMKNTSYASDWIPYIVFIFGFSIVPVSALISGCEDVYLSMHCPVCGLPPEKYRSGLQRTYGYRCKNKHTWEVDFSMD